MQIEQAILKHLRADKAVKKLVAQRIYYVKAPQDVGKPYIVFFKISGMREHSHDGASGLAQPRFQFSIFSDKYSDCKAIAAAVQEALQGYSGTMGGSGGVYVNGVFYVDETDFYEEDTELYHVACDYFFWHEE